MHKGIYLVACTLFCQVNSNTLSHKVELIQYLRIAENFEDAIRANGSNNISPITVAAGHLKPDGNTILMFS